MSGRKEHEDQMSQGTPGEIVNMFGESINRPKDTIESLLERIRLSVENARSRGLSPAMVRLFKESGVTISGMEELKRINDHLQGVIRFLQTRFVAQCHALAVVLTKSPKDVRNVSLKALMVNLPIGVEVMCFKNLDDPDLGELTHGLIIERVPNEAGDIEFIKMDVISAAGSVVKSIPVGSLGTGPDQFVLVPVFQGFQSCELPVDAGPAEEIPEKAD